MLFIHRQGSDSTPLNMDGGAYTRERGREGQYGRVQVAISRQSCRRGIDRVKGGWAFTPTSASRGENTFTRDRGILLSVYFLVCRLEGLAGHAYL